MMEATTRATAALAECQGFKRMATAVPADEDTHPAAVGGRVVRVTVGGGVMLCCYVECVRAPFPFASEC